MPINASYTKEVRLDFRLTPEDEKAIAEGLNLFSELTLGDVRYLVSLGKQVEEVEKEAEDGAEISLEEVEKVIEMLPEAEVQID